MIENVLANWKPFIIIIAVLVCAVAAMCVLSVFFIRSIKKAGVDEIKAGPVEIDFSEDDK